MLFFYKKRGESFESGSFFFAKQRALIKLVAKLSVHPGVQIVYTRVYKPCTWGCAKCVHPGGDENGSPAK